MLTNQIYGFASLAKQLSDYFAAEDIRTDEDCPQSSGQLWGEEGDVHPSSEGKERSKTGKKKTIVVSVKEALRNGKAKKGNVYHAAIVSAAMQWGRCDGSEVKFDDNARVLIDKQGQPISTRVSGPVPHGLRKKNHVKIFNTSTAHCLIRCRFLILIYQNEMDIPTL